MSELKYFHREYNYLQEAGEEFARKYAVGRELRFSDQQNKDPFVERLLEAFAFLCGRIHERLDDDVPEFSSGLLEQLLPHLLRPFPSCSILKVHPVSGTVTRSVDIPRGSEVRSGLDKVPYKEYAKDRKGGKNLFQPAEFIFSTTQPLTVLPIQIEDVRVEDDASGKSSLYLTFTMNRNVTFSSLDMSKLTLYLAGNLRLKYTLLRYLVEFTESLSIREVFPKTSKENAFQSIDDFRIDIPELTRDLEDGENRSLIPYARQAFSGYRILQEYFAFPDRFFFIEINGLDTFQASEDGLPIELKFKFDRSLPKEFMPTKRNFDLNCVPIINLFEESTEPVSITQRMSEYPVVPAYNRDKSREIYAVKEVTGVLDKNRGQYHYSPVASYGILDEKDPTYASKRFFSIIFRSVEEELGETAIRLFGQSIDGEEFPKETLSIKAIMSNAFWPRKKIKDGDITEATGFPEGLAVSNITVPTTPRECPKQQNFLWSLISHLTVNFSTLAEKSTMKALLGLYNWSSQQDNNDYNRKKIENGIIDVHPPEQKTIPVEVPLGDEKDPRMKRIFTRGIELRLDIDSKYFENGEGDIFLFCLVLSKFLSQYATINSSIIVKLVDKKSKQEYTWKPTSGKILTI